MKRSLLLLFLVEAFSLANISKAQTWIQFAFATNNYWPYVACSADGTTMFAVQEDPYQNVKGIYKSTNSGMSWQKTTAPTNLHFTGLVSSADGSHAAFSSLNGIYSSTNGGEAWGLTGATNGGWWNLVSSADGMRLAALTNGANFLLFTSTNAGATWIQRGITNPPIPGYWDWASLAVSADGTTIVGQAGGVTYRSTNFGETSYQLVAAPHYSQSSVPSQNIAASADGIKIVAAFIGSGSFTNFHPKPCPIFLSTNSGATWMQTSAFSNYWSVVAMSADGTKIVAAAGGGYAYTNALIATSTNSGATWTTNYYTRQEFHFAQCSADGGKMVVSSGFIAYSGGIFTTYTPPNPRLSLLSTNGQLKLSWTVPSTNLLLQQSSNLQNWLATTNSPTLNTDNLQNELLVPAVNGGQFFRLATP